MIFRNPLRPFAPFPHPPGQWYSPLDAKAEAAGVALVEQAFAECPALAKLASALGRLIGDHARGQLALKKTLHGAFEGRLRTLALRADPPGAHGFGPISLPTGDHPLDSWLAPGLGLSARPAGFVDTFWHRVEVIALAVALVARAAWIGLRFGRWRMAPRFCRLLALNAAPDPRWAQIADALVEMSAFRPGDLLAEGDTSAPFRPDGLPVFLQATLPVAIGAWLKYAVLGSARLAMTAVTVGLGGMSDARAAEAAIQTLRLANRVLDARRIVGAIRAEACLENVEYSPFHILVGALASGTLTARLPHSEMDTPGVGLSYLGYDYFLSSGTYQFDSFGHTWLQGARAVGVGPLHEDGRFRKDAPMEPEYEAAIAAELAKGRRMIVIFGPSDVAGIRPLFMRLIGVVLRIVARHEGWFVVIKPKRRNWLYKEANLYPGLEQLLRHDRVICIHYPESRLEICPAAQLMKKMTLGISLGGSVVTEALCRDRAVMIYHPVVGETPLRKKLLDLGLLHASEESFRNALDAFMDSPQEKDIPFAWFRGRFDPFGDNQTLNRMAAVLYPPSGQDHALPDPGRTVCKMGTL